MRSIAPILAAVVLACGGDSSGPAGVATVVVSPSSMTLPPGGNVQLTAAAKDANGSSLGGRTVSWTSSASQIASVNAQGLVTGVAEGQAVITATIQGITGSSSLTVQLPVASVSVTPSTPLMVVGTTLQMTATPRDATGGALTSRAVAWSSSNTSVATVSAAGIVTGVATGTATITASSEGKGGTAAVQVTQEVATGTLTSIVAGFETTCAMNSVGSAFCWGDGTRGQIGTGVLVSSSVPLPLSDSYTAVAPGVYHSCAITATGTASCWGENVGGALGDGSTTNRATPGEVVGGMTFTSIGVGFHFSCGLASSHQIWCWGVNDLGSLGTGNTTSSSTPAPIITRTFRSLTVGFQHACALTSAGEAYCWGDNRNGALGDGTTTNATSPVPVAGGFTFVSLSAGEQFTCGLTAAGTAYCWGANSSGQLGNSITMPRSLTPYGVSGEYTFTAIDAGNTGACGITATGTAYCWGAGDRGQLGNAGTVSSPGPVLVSGGLGFTSISTGLGYSCGMTAAGAYCWGRNDSGKLGNGNNVDSPVPVKVRGQP